MSSVFGWNNCLVIIVILLLGIVTSSVNLIIIDMSLFIDVTPIFLLLTHYLMG